MSIFQNLEQVREIIQQAEQRPGSVTLLAVSKGQNIDKIQEAIAAKQYAFGENYIQEALPKIQALQDYPLIWHFIGPIQSNKCKHIAENFDWVHSVCRENVAKKLNDHRPTSLPPLNVCIQVNLTQEATKSGISAEEAASLARYIAQLPNLHLRGLMLIPPILQDPEKQYELFLQLADCMHTINIKEAVSMDTLSMGMSDDFIPAIRAGSTMVRIGRHIFGDRIKQ